MKIFIIVYISVISLWFFLWLSVADATWWLTGLNRIVLYFFVPVPLLFILAILSHRRKLAALLIVPVLIFAILYAPYLFPKSVTIVDGTELRIMTYNVLFSNPDYDAVSNVILTYQPDIIALQEVRPRMMKEVAKQIGADYPYSLLGTENQYGTTAVFSKYPILNSYVLDLQAGRPAVVIQTKINETKITFISTHLRAYGLRWVPLPEIPNAIRQRTVEQNQQANLLLEEIEKLGGTAIIGCDCNSKETSSSYRILARNMSNAAREIGWTIEDHPIANVKPDINLNHIDYVFYQGKIEPTGVYKVKDNGGSDHLPLLVTFNLN